MNKIELNSLTKDQLREYMVSIGEQPFRGVQLFSYLNKNMNLDLNNITVLNKKLREFLINNTRVNKINILERFDSKIDDTKKYLFNLEDKNVIEGVFMQYTHGTTACISTQIGCKMGCRFCASTKSGLIRNLSVSEMVNQIYLMEKDLEKPINNIVLMGSGEPLDNYDNVLKFINVIHDEDGHNISLRNITLSTCGIVPKIYELSKENLPITLSISLHSPFDEDRGKIMPIAKRYKIKELMEACKFYGDVTNRRLTFEYTLIEGVNDREKDVKELVKIMWGINSHINLIPLNPIIEYNKESTSYTNIKKFQSKLEQNNIPTTIRKEKGGDISASCGQLRRSFLESK